MGLFKNDVEHPEIYINHTEIKEPNQPFYKVDYFQELVEEQKKINEEMVSSFRYLKETYNLHEKIQKNRWDVTKSQLMKLNERSDRHENLEKETIQHIINLENKQEEIQRHLREEHSFKQHIEEDLGQLKEMNEQLIHCIRESESVNSQLSSKIEELVEMNKEMNIKLTKLEQQQTDVSERIEKQEALLDKAIRQLTNLRSILYERTHELAEKIENGIKFMTTSVYKFVYPKKTLMMKDNDQHKIKK